MIPAPCLTVDPEIFFSEAPKKVAQAKALCATCPGQSECLSIALTAEIDAPLSDRFGIFGGLTPRERIAL